VRVARDPCLLLFARVATACETRRRQAGPRPHAASRRLTRIQTDLRKRVTKILVDERGWTPSETERSFAEVAQHLDTDLESLLNREAADLGR
jgi:hypothetical protein